MTLSEGEIFETRTRYRLFFSVKKGEKPREEKTESEIKAGRSFTKTPLKTPWKEPSPLLWWAHKESKEPTFSETFSEKFREESAKPTPRGFWVFGILFTVPSFAFVVFPLLHGTDLYYWFEGVGLEFLFLFFPSAILGFLFGMGLAEFLQKRKNRKND